MDEPDETFTVTLSVPSHARWQPQRRLWQPNVDGMRVAVAGPYGHERVTAWQDGADAQRKKYRRGFRFVWPSTRAGRHPRPRLKGGQLGGPYFGTLKIAIRVFP